MGAGLESFTDGPPFTLQRLCEVSQSNFLVLVEGKFSSVYLGMCLKLGSWHLL